MRPANLTPPKPLRDKPLTRDDVRVFVDMLQERGTLRGFEYAIPWVTHYPKSCDLEVWVLWRRAPRELRKRGSGGWSGRKSLIRSVASEFGVTVRISRVSGVHVPPEHGVHVLEDATLYRPGTHPRTVSGAPLLRGSRDRVRVAMREFFRECGDELAECELRKWGNGWRLSATGKAGNGVGRWERQTATLADMEAEILLERYRLQLAKQRSGT